MMQDRARYQRERRQRFWAWYVVLLCASITIISYQLAYDLGLLVWVGICLQVASEHVAKNFAVTHKKILEDYGCWNSAEEPGNGV